MESVLHEASRLWKDWTLIYFHDAFDLIRVHHGGEAHLPAGLIAGVLRSCWMRARIDV